MSSKPLRRRNGLRAALVLAAFLIPVCAAAQPPYLVADLNTQPVNGSSVPFPFGLSAPPRAEMGGVFYFAAADPMHGLELWRSDGTPGGTRLVRDIRPGRSGSNLLSLTVHQGRLYFFADDGVWGQELWSSDGTREGTLLVRDTCPGSCPGTWEYDNFITPAGPQLFFGSGRFQDLDLWRSDGTREGTWRVVDSCPGCSNQIEDGVTPLPDGRVFFTANHPETGWELWVSDGTPEGTRALDLAPGLQSSGPAGLIALGNRLLFWTYDFPTGRFDLWVSDGTLAGSRVVRTNVLRPGFDGGPVVWKGAVYFSNELGELWRTNGTARGTILLKNFETGPTPYSTPYRPTRLTPLQDGVLFIAGDSARGMALWRTRGTRATTRPLKDPVPGPASPDLTNLHRAGNRAFFLARDPEGPIDLWVTDGRTGTRRVTLFCSTTDECAFPTPVDLTGTGGLAFFTVHSKLVGSELWRSDGSAAGTFQVRDIHSGAGSALLSDIAALDGRALFGALTTSPNEAPPVLWRSDGTAAGTVLVDGGATWPQDFLRQGDHLVFSGALPWSFSEPFFSRRQGLWRTDGTPAGTRQIGDLFDLDLLAVDGDLLFLGAGDREDSNGTGVEPWHSDGTQEGTRQIADLDQELEWLTHSPPLAVPGSSHPGVPVRLGPALLFAADDGLFGRELWATDGTAAGTRRVKNIHQQFPHPELEGSSDPEFLVRLGGVVLFAADDGLSGRELWVTDGTEAGTRRLLDLRPGAEGSRPHDLVVLGGRVYFFASAGGNGEALWRTDGTEGGTFQVKSLVRQGLPSWGRELTVAGSRLFFVADNESTGPELHTSNGTSAGTRLVQIRPGPNGSYPQSLTVVDGLLVFAADDGAHGLEPWRSDGTDAGTYSLGDLAPGQAASAASELTPAGSLLFFAADDGVHGRELWVVAVGQ
jgi:ELWxxDGT repeat protein